MSTEKRIEACAAVCRNAQTVIEEAEQAIAQFETDTECRAATMGMISAALYMMHGAAAHLKLCADDLYTALDK